MDPRVRTAAIAGGAVVAVGLVCALAIVLSVERESPVGRAVTVGFAERYGEDQWTFLMRETDGEGRTVLNYAPSDDAATMLVACLTFAGHEARTLDHGGYAWTAPTAQEQQRFDADLLHCRIAHPFPG
jgi:hypothetical protein